MKSARIDCQVYGEKREGNLHPIHEIDKRISHGKGNREIKLNIIN